MRAVLPIAAVFFLAGALMAQGDFERGLSYYKQGQYERAITEFEKIVEANPDYEDGYRILGDCYLKTRKFDQAITAFQKALQLNNRNYVSYYGLGLAYFNLGRFREAVTTLTRGESYARSPRDQHDLHRTRGAAYYNLKDYNRAIADLRKAVSIQRGSPQEILQLGLAHYQLSDFPEAERYLRQALALDPGSAEARRYLAQISYNRAVEALEGRRYQEAARLFQQHVQENPSDGSAWFNLGLAHLSMENVKAAEEAFLQSTRLAPDHWESFDQLGYIYEMKTREYNKSLQYYRRAAELNRNSQIQESVKRVEERIRRQREGLEAG
jgi:tetratricopeptide (TPR) repeat protein